MKSDAEIQKELNQLKSEYGEWSYDIPLPFNIWTRGNLQIPHTRLRRIVQIVSDLSRKPLSECRVLDLGCLDGMFSIEFAKHGAQTVGVEIREANIKKAIFSKEALELHNLEFRQDDARNISVESYGRFDAIICSGLLYHLTAVDAIDVINRMYSLVDGVVVIDTHVALKPVARYIDGKDEYWGSVFREHTDGATLEQKSRSLWASADNTTSFWFTRPSLVNILSKAGFSSVYECLLPAHLNFGKPGQEHQDRCAIVAIKNNLCDIVTSPSVNNLKENWPENTLSYFPGNAKKQSLRTLYQRALTWLKRMVS